MSNLIKVFVFPFDLSCEEFHSNIDSVPDANLRQTNLKMTSQIKTDPVRKGRQTLCNKLRAVYGAEMQNSDAQIKWTVNVAH